MNGVEGLYGGIDMAKVMFGEAARRIGPMHMWVQGADRETAISFVGASRVGIPLRFGSDRTHQLIVGDLIVIPRAVIATDVMQGHGLAGLITDVPTGPELLQEGEIVYLAPGYHDDLSRRDHT